MPNNFLSPQGDLERLFVTDYDQLDRYVTAGTQWTWGVNTQGQLGNNNATTQTSPVQTIALGTNWRQVSAGFRHIIATKTDGTLWAWGWNAYGQLGTNTAVATNISSPLQVVGIPTNWVKVTTGWHSSGAIKNDGTLWMWGRGTNGEIGNGAATNRSSPTQVGTLVNWKDVHIAGTSVLGLRNDGTLWAWGSNSYGQLGDNTVTVRSSPVQILGNANTWAKISNPGNSFGTFQMGAIKTDGTLWMWGDNSKGQVGQGSLTITRYSSPVQIAGGGTNWKQLSIGFNASAGIKTDGTLWMWGTNTNGELGTNNITQYLSPVQTVSGGTNWKQVITGYRYTTAIKTDGTLWIWGQNYGSAIFAGGSGASAVSSPIQISAGGTNWKQVSSSGTCVGAIFYNTYDNMYPTN